MQLSRGVLVILGCTAALLVATPSRAQISGPPASPESSGPAIGEPPGVPLPVVALILDRERELGLSPAQVESLRRLGLEMLRASIRRQADLMLAQVDLWTLLDRPPDRTMDVAGGEAKIREAAQIRTDLEIAFLRAMEAARNQLTADQRSRLTVLLTSAGPADPPGISTDPPSDARGAGHGPSGGAAGHPPGGRPPAGPPPGRPPGGPPPGGHPHGGGGHVYIWGGPLWWGAPYPYWGYPAWWYVPPPAAVEPPQYIQPEPPAYWYYCPSANAYYPSVPTCPEPWVQVAPTG